MLKESNRLETIVIEPKSAATKSVIWLHGLGADGNDFVNIAAELHLPQNLNVRFIFPHAPVRPVTINNHMQMRAWFDIYSLSNLSQEDTAGILHSQALINDLIQQEIDNGISSEKIILAGFSQGGAMALFTGIRYPQKLGGILALSTYLPLLNSLPKEASPINQGVPIMLVHGEHDEIVPVRLGEYTRNRLEELSYKIRWKNYSMGHQVCMEEIADIGRWLVERLS